MHNYCLLCFVNCHHSWHLFNNYKRKKWRTIFCIEKKIYAPLKNYPFITSFFERHEGMQNPISAFSNPILCSLFLQKKKKYPIFEKNVIILLSWWMLRFWPHWWTQNQCKQENDAQEKFMNQDGEEKRDLHYYSIYKKKTATTKKEET